MENDEKQEVTPEESNDIEVIEEGTESEIDWKAEALKQKAINQRLSKKIGTPEPKQDITKPKTEQDDIHKTVAELALAEKKRQFGYANGLSPEEADAVFRLDPNPTKETLEDPFVKGGLAQIRAKRRVDNNTPTSSSRSAKPLTFKPDATPADKQKAHDEWVKGWTPKR